MQQNSSGEANSSSTIQTVLYFIELNFTIVLLTAPICSYHEPSEFSPRPLILLF